MAKDKATIIREAVESLMETFKTGKMPKQIALSIINKHEGSIIPSDSWSIGNRVLMLAQKTNDARGYKQWQEAGRNVKKGVHAIYIFAPLTRKVKETDEATNEEKEKVITVGFRPIPVFRLEDTEGALLLSSQEYAPPTFPPFFDVTGKLGIEVAYTPLRGNYFGKFSKYSNFIQLCSHDANVYYHELAHAVHSRFVDLGKYDKDKAEIVAEFTACTLCELNGIRGYEKQGYDYIKRYAKDDKPEAVLKKIMSVLSDVEKIITTILNVTGDKLPVAEPVRAVA